MDREKTRTWRNKKETANGTLYHLSPFRDIITHFPAKPISCKRSSYPGTWITSQSLPASPQNSILRSSHHRPINSQRRRHLKNRGQWRRQTVRRQRYRHDDTSRVLLNEEVSLPMTRSCSPLFQRSQGSFRIRRPQ